MDWAKINELWRQAGSPTAECEHDWYWIVGRSTWTVLQWFLTPAAKVNPCGCQKGDLMLGLPVVLVDGAGAVLMNGGT
jgi:hypothetical protein